MCGIWGYIGKLMNETALFDAYNNLKIRGPDRSEFFQINGFTNLTIGFHRLAIIGNNVFSDQPFTHEDENYLYYMAGNEEIFNYKELIKEHKLEVKSDSDGEVILRMFLKYGIDKCLEQINGEYAFYILMIDKKSKKHILYLARDHCGIRPMFYFHEEESLGFSSQLKGLISYMNTDKVLPMSKNVKQFPPRHYMKFGISQVEGKTSIVLEKK